MTLKSSVNDLYCSSVTLISHVFERYNMLEILAPVTWCFETYPVLSVIFCFMVIAYAIPLLVFLSFVVVSGIISFTGFLIIEGTILGIAFMILLSVFATLTFILCSALFVCSVMYIAVSQTCQILLPNWTPPIRIPESPITNNNHRRRHNHHIHHELHQIQE